MTPSGNPHSGHPARTAQARREPFGTLADGSGVDAVVLSNRRGLTARIIAFGASLQSLLAPDRDGRPANISLGYASLDGYLREPHYVGATVGRYANRIAGGRFELDGRVYRLPVNNGPNSLHGGTRGFDKALWTIDAIEQEAGRASVRLSHISPDGDMGYPGSLRVTALYTLDDGGLDDGGAEDCGRLSIEYRATTDRPTLVNLSHHAYWNLAGENSGSAMQQRLAIFADAYLPVDENLIPTGEFRDVSGTAFDFRQAKPIDCDIHRDGEIQLRYGHGYDHSWAIGRALTEEPRLAARAEDPVSGRVLSLWSNQPGLQFYAGNFLQGGMAGSGGRVYRPGDGFALEPQLFPDTPNRADFGSARLAPGECYRGVIVYGFGVEG
jgi:aldose 1-epimerase